MQLSNIQKVEIQLKMSINDSFNDSDEIISLYSSKKVTETFRAQLKKIVANSNNVTTSLSKVNSEKVNSSEVNKEEISPEIKTIEVSSSPNTSTEKLEDVPKKAPSRVSKNSSPNDGLEVIEVRRYPTRQRRSSSGSVEVIEITPSSSRRSDRLRKRKGGRSETSKSSNANLNGGSNRLEVNRRRRKSRGRKQRNGTPVAEITLDNSPESPEIDDELNPEVSVKVIWKSVEIKKFTIRKFQKLSRIFEQLSKEEGVPENKIMLTFNNIRVNPSDTPDSLNLQVYHFLDGGILTETSALCQTSNSLAPESDSNLLTIKFQDVNKKVIVVNLNKTEKLKVGMIMCSEQLEIPLHKIKFFFDGDPLEPSETPESLGLENGEVIDIKIIK